MTGRAAIKRAAASGVTFAVGRLAQPASINAPNV